MLLASAAIQMGLNKVGARDSSVEKLIQLFPDYNNNVIIFDDLERCECFINEVLGYINYFVEHSSASVILVANESEINNNQFDKNPELQTAVAMSPNIEIDLPKTTKDYVNNYRGKEKVEKQSFSVEEVFLRRKRIFHGNEIYKTIKEKVIGLTINYEPDLRGVFNCLINDKKIDSGLGNLLNQHVDWFSQKAVTEEHRNIRTFQFFLEKISMIFECINNIHNNIHNQFYETIIHYTFSSSITYMKGLDLPKWNEEYGEQGFAGNGYYNSENEIGFRFIDELIQTNTIDKERVNRVLSHCVEIAEKKGQLRNDPYQYIRDWWMAEDQEIVEWLTGIRDNIKRGKYSTELYSELLKYLAELKYHHVKEQLCEQIVDEMEKHINKIESSMIINLDRQRFLLDEEIAKIYKDMFNRIESLIISVKAESEKQKYINAIQDKQRWGTRLLKLSSSQDCLREHSFIYWVKPDQIVDRINESSNSELYQLRQALLQLYDSNSFYEIRKDDYNNLNVILKKLENTDDTNWGEVKRVYKKWIISDLSKYIEKTKPSELLEKD